MVSLEIGILGFTAAAGTGLYTKKLLPVKLRMTFNYIYPSAWRVKVKNVDYMKLTLIKSINDMAFINKQLACL